jgi:hypothetical protein
MEEHQPSADLSSAGPSEAPSASVSDTASSSAASETSGGLTDDKLTASLSAVYDRAEAREPQSTEASHSTPDSLPPSINGRMNPDTWAAMPKEAQQLFLQREQEAQAKISQAGRELAELRKAGGTSAELGNVIGKYANHIPRGPDGNPMPPAVVMESLLAAHHALETHPAQALAWLAQSYGIPLAALGQDPEAVALQQRETAQYRQQLAQLQQQQSRYQSQRQAYLQKEIEGLITGKEHWGTIEEECVRQVEAVRSQNPSLYEADPIRVVREAITRAEKIAGVNDAAETVKKAREAKRLASLNVKSSVGKSPSNVSGGMFDTSTWENAYSKANR